MGGDVELEYERVSTELCRGEWSGRELILGKNPTLSPRPWLWPMETVSGGSVWCHSLVYLPAQPTMNSAMKRDGSK